MYFQRHNVPVTPYEIIDHACVNIRHKPSGAIYAWEFVQDGKEFTVKGNGQLIFNSIMHVMNGAIEGLELAYVPEEPAAPHLADGRIFQDFIYTIEIAVRHPPRLPYSLMHYGIASSLEGCPPFRSTKRAPSTMISI
ncbi:MULTISPECIES: hypothetical protein [Rhizobium]|uniref:Uncharacterized protein n=1 Tax=Rhizobium rhododendri TaxID=2506430 RepID=A0ABY8IU27_9HYPH|nr:MULTISPECIES: hypothetical protein [Rhizobium]TQX84234.1 hypothetical protein EQW76_25820 [Rhizobium sp. rho-13.1]TQY07793.1 hypothetical protein EQW74_24950 [Rhizobium sp. rho-1.1]WFS26345.1 hypothetical protein PR018_25320 [Rhizobium rhododendri]